MLLMRFFVFRRGLRAVSVATATATATGLALVGCASVLHGHADHVDPSEQAAPADAPPALPRVPAPAGARAYIISPSNHATVTSPFVVGFGLSNMGVAPAGVKNPKTGHHHLIIDAPTPPGHLPVPADENHRHFGGGQTEVKLELAPGKHTLQLVLGDHLHIPHDPPIVSEVISIHVE